MISSEGNGERDIFSHFVVVDPKKMENKNIGTESEISHEHIDISKLVEDLAANLVSEIKEEYKKKDKIKLIKEMIQEGDDLQILEIEDQPIQVIIKQGIQEKLPQRNRNQIYADVLKKIEEKLKSDQELSGVASKNIYIERNKTIPKSPHLSFADNLANEPAFFREDDFSNLSLRKEDEEMQREAFLKFLKLPQNEHVINYEKYSPEDARGMMQELQLVDLREMLKIPETKILEVLEVLRDCVEGCIFLEENDLVLQDICLNNLGCVRDSEGKAKGILPDLEGLYFMHKSRKSRIINDPAQSGYAPGWKPFYLPPEASVEDVTKVMPSEMVYQFGQCLKKIVESAQFKNAVDADKTFSDKVIDFVRNKPSKEEVLRTIWGLIKDMTFFDAENENHLSKRISLKDSLPRINDLIEKVRKISS
jgi:hypothetical protein